MSQRSAISRIQHLVVLLIVTLVVGLFLSWVSKVRNAADTMSCSNNLKQFGLAIQNYDDSMSQLPPLVDQGENAPTGNGFPSAFASLLPFIEATPVTFRGERHTDFYNAHSSVELTYPGKPDTGPVIDHGGMANNWLKVFLDPSDRTSDRLRDIPMTLPDGTTGYYAAGSYAANGMVPWNTGSLSKSFPNGLANTILIGERPQVCQSPNGETIYNLWGLGFYSPNMPAFATLTPNDPRGMFSTNQIAPALPLPDDSSNYRVRIGRMDAESELPDFTSPIQFICPGRPCDPRLSGTPHRTGMQVVMADGSVRTFSLSTSPLVFWAACTPTAE